jgi:biopolymer transport protein ExbB/TolQ
MEITSFVLGMLAIVTVAMVAVIVVGIVKILKLSKHVNDLQTDFFQTRGDLYRNIEERIHPVWRQFEETGRDITMVEKTIMNQIDQTNQELHRRIDQTKQEVERTIHETHAAIDHVSMGDRKYIDSRIDKLIDTYFEHVGAKSKKEFING